MTEETDVICTIIGGAKAAHAVADAGAMLGRETMRHPPDVDHPIDFLDYPFTNEDATFEDHLQAVKDTEPKYTVSPDIEGDLQLADAVTLADELNQHAEHVILVPKENAHPDDVPDRFRIGIPLAHGFGSSAPWAAWDYRGNGPFHLLGGSPTLQFKATQFIGREAVASLDSASPMKAAQFGDVWDGGWIPDQDHIDVYERITESFRNLVAQWNRPASSPPASD